MAATDIVRARLGPPRRSARAGNDNRTVEQVAARLEAASWTLAIGFMWATVLVPLSAILWGTP